MPEPASQRKVAAGSEDPVLARSDLVIAVMARSPAGPTESIKTRLAGVVPDAATRVALYGAFLGDTLAACRRVPGAVVRLAYTPEGGADGFTAFGLGPDDLVPQRGNDLGQRERSLFDDLFAAGFRRALIVGSDLPTLPPEHLSEAACDLQPERRVVVLGPSADGGYYLIGLAANPARHMMPDLFRDVRWSTAHTLADTIKAAGRAQWEVKLAAGWYDVDDAEGLKRLEADLRRPGRTAHAPRTAAVLRRLRRLPER